MIIYIQISNYNQRLCGTWDHAPTDNERVIEFNKDRQQNEPQITSHAEYHSMVYNLNINNE